MKVRYIRDWQNGKIINGVEGNNCDWREIKALDYFGNNIAFKKNVEFSHTMNGNSSAIVNNNFDDTVWTNAEPGTKKNCTIDLGGIYEINKIIIARAKNPTICKETKIEVSIDKVKWVTIFNSETENTYEEPINGKEFNLAISLPLNPPTEESSISEHLYFFNHYAEFLKVQKDILKTELNNLSSKVGNIGSFNNLTLEEIVKEFGKLIKNIKNLPPWVNLEGGIWIGAKNMPNKRYGLKSSVVGDKIYCIGGRIADGYSSRNECYDTVNNTWATKADMPTARYRFGSSVVGTNIYCFGGQKNGTAAILNCNTSYDTITDTWTYKANMFSGREGFTSSAVGTNIYCIGGAINSNKNECYDTKTNTWTTKTNMPTGRHNFTSSAVGTNIYCIGGVSKEKNECYDTKTNTWTTKAKMGYTYDLTSSVVGTNIYCIGGYNHINENKCYDTKTNTWTTKANMPTGRYDLTSSTVNNNIYCIGGYYNSNINNNYDNNECYIV